jgi:antitoxin MazE
MRTRLSKWGNSLAVRIPRQIAEELQLATGDEVELTAAGSRVAIETRPGQKVPRYRLEDMIADMKRLPPESRPPLLDWGPDRGAEILPDEDWSDIAPVDDDEVPSRDDRPGKRS